MNTFIERATVKQLQWLVWIFVCLIIFGSYAAMDGVVQSAWWALMNTAFYATIIYGNILFLFPRLYEKGKKGLYLAVIIPSICLLALGRASLVWWTYNHFFAMGKPEAFGASLLLSSLMSGLFMLVMSLIFRIALAYFSLKKQKSQVELNLLKSQVQPHFLFNTLNNIYYESYREAPRTALLIERLSGIMRYFVDESPKEYVLLSTEIQFLENYMALEQIRIRYGVRINFTKTCNPEVRVPPLLLMTFVENVFKHGIDKNSHGNSVDISLEARDGYLYFQTANRVPPPQSHAPGTGFGIRNLSERLRLLYKTDFELGTETRGDRFIALLKFPLT